MDKNRRDCGDSSLNLGQTCSLSEKPSNWQSTEIERAIEKKEYIERGALLKAFGCENAVKYGNKNAEQQHKSYSSMMLYEIADEIYDAPAADVEPVVRGEWIWKPPYTICSVCGRHSINRFQSRYCQHCGAKMNNPRGAHMERSGSGE